MVVTASGHRHREDAALAHSGAADRIFGLALPKLLATRTPGRGLTGDVHGLLANCAMLGLFSLHVAAALYCHFVRRDGVLKRMLRARKRICLP